MSSLHEYTNNFGYPLVTCYPCLIFEILVFYLSLRWPKVEGKIEAFPMSSINSKSSQFGFTAVRDHVAVTRITSTLSLYKTNVVYTKIKKTRVN